MNSTHQNDANGVPPLAAPAGSDGWMSEANEGSLHYPVGQCDMVRDDRLVYECRACSNDLHVYHCRTEMPPDMTPVRCLFYDAAGQHPDWYRVDW